MFLSSLHFFPYVISYTLFIKTPLLFILFTLTQQLLYTFFFFCFVAPFIQYGGAKLIEFLETSDWFPWAFLFARGQSSRSSLCRVVN